MKAATLAAAALLLVFPTSAAFAQGAAPTGPGTMQPIPNPPEAPKHHTGRRHHHKHAHHHKTPSQPSSNTAKAK